MAAVFDIASITNQHTFNLERWEKICRDPAFRLERSFRPSMP
ncbi:MAG: hypothetical protein ACR2OZ_02820 [Verrucomicrobiales bacterium]